MRRAVVDLGRRGVPSGRPRCPTSLPRQEPSSRQSSSRMGLSRRSESMTSVSGVGPEAERVTLVPPSCLHAVFRSVEAYEETSRKAVIRLHVGEPSYAPPSEAVEALADAVCSGRAAYSSAEGLPALRTALARKLAHKNQIHTSDSTIMVSVGSTQGLFALMQSLHVDRAEMLLPAIHWPIHLQQCLLTGFRPAFYPLRADFGLD